MNYSYIHEAAGNYMIIYGKDIIKDYDYPVMIFKKNKLNRFLELKVNFVDNEAKYYYNISSRQSLKHLFDSKKLKYEEMVTIVSGIKEAVEEIERYLLNPASMVLEPDIIYVNPITNEPEFCYNPEYNVGIVEGIRELFRYFLNIIDNSDKKTVEYAYDIYCRAMQDDFSLNIILENADINNTEYKECKIKAANFEENENNLYVETVKHKYIIEKVCKLVCRLFNKVYNNNKILDKENLYNNEEFLEENEECKTELLNVSKYNYRLLSVDGEGIIEISEFPYIIGKLSGKVNEIIYSDKVSRLHAKIIKNENKVYIMDMNSKNGTYINGIRILLYEQKELNSGDKVRFADMEYIYEQVH